MAGLKRDDAGIVQSSGVVGLAGENLTVEAFRLGQSSRLVKLESELEGIWGGGGQHGKGSFAGTSKAAKS
jgi:hypothetical protein